MAELYDIEKAIKVRELAEASFMALTGDHKFIIQANASFFKLQLIMINHSL